MNGLNFIQNTGWAGVSYTVISAGISLLHPTSWERSCSDYYSNCAAVQNYFSKYSGLLYTSVYDLCHTEFCSEETIEMSQRKSIAGASLVAGGLLLAGFSIYRFFVPNR